MSNQLTIVVSFDPASLAAINALAGKTATAEKTVTTTSKTVSKPAQKPAQKPVAKKAVSKYDEPEEEEVEETEEETEEVQATKEDVIAALEAYEAQHSRKEALAMMKKWGGAASLKDIDPSNYTKVVEALS